MSFRTDVGVLEFEQRLKKYESVIAQSFWSLYEKNEHNGVWFKQLHDVLRKTFEERDERLRLLDLKRLAEPEWYLSANMIGITLYVDLFAETLAGLRDKLLYFKELGITYIHLLPIFKTRPGQDDGGYAVSDFTDVHERLGTLADLKLLIRELHDHGISICLDFIMNHTAKEHEWAMRARSGEPEYQDMYFMYDSYEIPAAFEQALPQIFPDTAPGNFTYYEDLNKWVFTTFYEFQWDLNYRNPQTLIRIIENILFLTNVGVDVFRIDAIRHIWKEVGTDCSSLPETYIITDLLKACAYVTSSGVLFLGEATTTLDEVMKYMGTEDKGCQFMYNVSFLTAAWNALATEDARYLADLITGSPQLPQGTCWKNYLRCHDDLGFVMDRRFAEPLGINAVFQETLLVSFYKGNLPASFSAGELYCFDPQTRVSRVSGTLASFCGLEKALVAEDKQQVELAISRILLMYSLLLSYEGLPLLYAGDEIGQLNDYSYKLDPEKQADSRWLHRFSYRWDEYQMRSNATSIQGKIYQRLQKLITIRKSHEIFAANVRSEPFDTGNRAVYGATKNQENEHLVILANFSQEYCSLKHLQAVRYVNLITQEIVDLQHDQTLELKPYEYMWLRKENQKGS